MKQTIYVTGKIFWDAIREDGSSQLEIIQELKRIYRDHGIAIQFLYY